jgi:hypothetical protein
MDESHVTASRDRGSGSIREVSVNAALSKQSRRKKARLLFIAGLFFDHAAVTSASAVRSEAAIRIPSAAATA